MPRTILIVDDTPHSASTLEVALLAIPGASVVHACSGGRALEMLEAGSPEAVDILVTDLHMPSMDGFELVARVRARFDRLPIVVLSGDTDPATPERLRRLGVDAYFAKPYSPAQVRKKVEELLDATLG
ncbi:MAG: response regulator [Bryobacterales bacterium]|nr:response regulator [Bryobacteraceae bacterium]MDW8353690.1 response regulator [Bryobacterales bacterium]